VEFLPSECGHKDSLSLLKELCSIAFSILKKKGAEGNAKFQPVFEFINEIISIHGESIEKRAMESANGQAVSDREGDFVVIITELLLSAVEEFQTASAAAAASLNTSKEQGNGQPAFESKALPAPKGEFVPSDEFCGMFSMFKTCVERCPVYFVQLPSAPGLERQDDPLYQRTIDTAIEFLNESDPDTSKHAIEFLAATVRTIFWCSLVWLQA
jgi:hypothetical protein